jgi:hypothetical protein
MRCFLLPLFSPRKQYKNQIKGITKQKVCHMLAREFINSIVQLFEITNESLGYLKKNAATGEMRIEVRQI